MRKKLFTLLLAVAASVGTMLAEKVQIGNLYYNLDATNLTAEVTSQNSGEYSGDIVIPSSVTYNSVSYSVTSIGSAAFRNCTNLTSVTIPNSVITLGAGAFRNCNSLTSVTLNSNAVVSKNYSAASNIENIFGSQVTEYILCDSITNIGYYAFYNCESLISITIPSSVTSIGDDAFEYCRSLNNITIPNSVASIGFRAFRYCTNLISVTIPNSVTSIGRYAFYSCTSLTSINVENNNPNYCSIEGVLFNKDQTMLVQYPSGKIGNPYIIPDGVLTIESSAFQNCKNLTSVTIPNSITTIEDYAFSGCAELQRVVMGNNVKTIGERTFENCTNLTSINIPNSVTYMGYRVFDYCENLPIINCIRYADTYLIEAVAKDLPTYNIANGTRWIGDYAFSDCQNLTSINIPNSIVGIGRYVFGGDSSLQSINIEEGNTFYCSVDGVVFNSDTTKLVEYPKGRQGGYIIPNGVALIKEYAFHSTMGLSSIVLPSSVDTIEEYAFTRCNGLKSIICYSTNPPETYYGLHGEDIFYGVDCSNIALYVPEESMELYEGAWTWNRFQIKSINTIKYYTITFVNWDGTELQSSMVIEDEIPAYTGATPERPEDEQNTYSFDGWSPAIVAATADATYTATYAATPKSQSIDEVPTDKVQCTKVVRNGQIFILRGDKIYILTGQEVR